jgi:hypothetical protein
MPLGVFFSRNLQPDSPAFFFMLLGSLFYLKYLSSLKKYNLFLGGLSFAIAWIYRFNFLFGALPFLFCLPLKKMLRDKRGLLRYLVLLLMPYLLILLTIYLTYWVIQQANLLIRFGVDQIGEKIILHLFALVSFVGWGALMTLIFNF